MRRTLAGLIIHIAVLAVAAAAGAQTLAPGEVLVGASKVSIEPAPNAFKGEFWETDASACTLPGSLLFALDTRTPWPENPNCIYSGGFGIGPMNPLTSWDEEYGLWSRSIAISDGEDTVVLTILDGAYYFGRYRNLCERCGFFSLAEDLGAELGIPPSGFLFTYTHSHAAPDFIGGWGAVPQWYMDQVANAMRRSVRRAVARMKPATLEAGDELLRGFNSERRDSYWSAEGATLPWFRAIDRAGSVIATAVAYARHPTSRDPVDGGHADWHATFSARAEQRFGGMAAAFPSGLGNKSGRGGWESGAGVADAIPEIGEGMPVTSPGGATPDVRSRQVFWTQPVTNSALLALGVNGLFDRPFQNAPATIVTGKSAADKCVSASALSVETAVSAVRIGNLTITGGPGELFSNLTNTIQEEEFEKGQPVTLPLSVANDGLGYIMQKFEYDYIAGQVTGFVGAEGLFEYEDAYAIDGCFGTMVLETTLGALDGL